MWKAIDTFLLDASLVFFLFSEIELIPFYTTLLACIFLGLEYGILVGLAVNIVFVLYVSARPSIEIEQDLLPQVFLVTPSRSLQYPAAEYIREKIMKECNCSDSTVVINGKYVKSIDTTVAKVKNAPPPSIFFFFWFSYYCHFFSSYPDDKYHSRFLGAIFMFYFRISKS